MTASTNYKPDGWHSITARISTRDPESLVAFIRQVFGAEGEYRSDRPSLLTIGDSMLMIGGAEARGVIPAFLYVYVPDAGATYQRAIQAGALSIEQPADTPYGDRRAMVKDPWGNTWQIATHLARRAT